MYIHTHIHSNFHKVHLPILGTNNIAIDSIVYVHHFIAISRMWEDKIYTHKEDKNQLGFNNLEQGKARQNKKLYTFYDNLV